jgi:hypothetical protein
VKEVRTVTTTWQEDQESLELLSIEICSAARIPFSHDDKRIQITYSVR